MYQVEQLVNPHKHVTFTLSCQFALTLFVMTLPNERFAKLLSKSGPLVSCYRVNLDAADSGGPPERIPSSFRSSSNKTPPPEHVLHKNMFRMKERDSVQRYELALLRNPNVKCLFEDFHGNFMNWSSAILMKISVLSTPLIFIKINSKDQSESADCLRFLSHKLKKMALFGILFAVTSFFS